MAFQGTMSSLLSIQTKRSSAVKMLSFNFSFKTVSFSLEEIEKFSDLIEPGLRKILEVLVKMFNMKRHI